MNTISIKKTFSWAWDMLLKHFWVLVGIFAIVIVTRAIFSTLSSYAGDHHMGWLSILITIVNVFIQIVFGISTVAIALKLYAGESVRVKEVFYTHGKFKDYILAGILYLLILCAGFILFIIPGFVWMIKYQFFPWLLIEKNLKPTEALRASARITAGNKWKLFWYWILSIGVSLVGLVVVGIGIIPAAALVFLGYTFLYKQLSAQYVEPTTVPVE
ncbi:MAG: hypothetical protein M1320_00935 [Patescibacteria group bacterium]|nr:hypothetical protein [Patescibacteria group bacterium]